MKLVSTIGIDLAKNTFHIHAVDKRGKKVYAKRLARHQVSLFMANAAKCQVVLEACGTAHYWARLFKSYGHQVCLINPAFVKPFVKSNKNDYNDAEAICEAFSRPSMRFVPVKTRQQQDILALHRSREMVMTQRTQVANHIRSQLAEQGVVTRKGIVYLKRLLSEIVCPENERISQSLKETLGVMNELLNNLEEQKRGFDQRIRHLSRQTEPCKRLEKISGIGPICSTLLYAKIGQGFDFKNGREAGAWAGLVPRQKTTGGKPTLLGISKRGDRYLRKNLIQGAKTVLIQVKNQPSGRRKWLEKMLARKPRNVVAVALANKNMRIAWSILKSGEDYQPEGKFTVSKNL